MRLASAMMAAALSLSLGLLACTRFTGTDDAVETDAGTASEPDAGGFVVVDNQSMATELAASDAIVVWSFAGGISAADPRAKGATVTPVSAQSAVSLQLIGDRVFFASNGTVYFADTNGDLFEGGARSITPQGTNLQIRAQYTFDNAVTFATASQIEWCAGAACGNTAPTQIALDASVGAMRSDPTGGALWLSAGSELRSYDSSTLAPKATIQVSGGVGAFIIDELKAFYTPSAGGVIYAKDLTSDAAATVLATIGGQRYAFALDAAFLYVAVFDAGTVLKVSKTTGAVTTIVTGLSEPRSLALSNGRLLVLTNGQIISYDVGQ